MKIIFNYKFKNWNTIINESRSNYYKANNSKKQEMNYVRMELIAQKIKPITEYPVKINCLWGCKTRNSDLDNKCIKNILDALQLFKIIKNDNMACIQEINHKYVKSDHEYLEIVVDNIMVDKKIKLMV